LLRAQRIHARTSTGTAQSFVAANVLIDIEPLYYMITGQHPLHRFFHTYIGATLIALGAILLMVGCNIVSARYFPWIREKLFGLTTRAICIGAGLGSYSHIILDSIMHDDIRPFAPFSESNALYRIISLPALHQACLYSGLFGVVVLGLRYALKPRTDR
jgi:hypothetical protein